MSRASARSSRASSPASRCACAGSVFSWRSAPYGVGIDVDPAGEDHAVEDVERLVDGLDARRHDESPTAGAFDRLDVVERHERRGQLPRAPSRGLRVRGDPDDRPIAHVRKPTQDGNGSVAPRNRDPTVHRCARRPDGRASC